MAKIPVRFKRVAAAFDELARARICESSGSEHSPENSLTDLSDLVNSFIETEHGNNDKYGKFNDDDEEIVEKVEKERSKASKMETKETLKSLFGCGDDDVTREIRDVIEDVFKVVGDMPLSAAAGFDKRVLMSELRERGLDAGLCKSKWEKTSTIMAGTHEYIDINVSNTRYIIEISLVEHFKVSRPTTRYTSTLGLFPQLFITNPDNLKQVIKIMNTCMKESMKKADMRVPPWRKQAYMQAKWFGSYKRTTKAVSSKVTTVLKVGDNRRLVVGFEALGEIGISHHLYYCGREYATSNCGREYATSNAGSNTSIYNVGSTIYNVGSKVGYLTAAFSDSAIQ